MADARAPTMPRPERRGGDTPRGHRTHEAPSRTALLRLALAIGRQQALDAPAMGAPAITAKTLAACPAPPTLAVGVISAPKNVDRRARMRASRDLLLRDDPCSATLTFILGHRSMLTAAEAHQLDSEQALYGDIALLDAHDGTKSGISHGGRAVAEKAIAWFIHSVHAHRAPFTCKLDDDTMPHLPNLVADLKVISARDWRWGGGAGGRHRQDNIARGTARSPLARHDACASRFAPVPQPPLHVSPPAEQAMQHEVPNPLSAYYGVQVYRLWDWQSVDKGGDPNAACGSHGDDGPPTKSPPSLLKLLRQQRPGGPCEHAAGPFLFPDGSLEIVGRAALVDVFNSSRVRSYASRHFGNERPPIWSHEDAALGALVHREVAERRLPLTFLAMRRWDHNVFWVNWADRKTLISGNTLWAHYTRSAERSDYVAGAYLATRGMARDAFVCVSCEDQWGWTPPHDQVACCTKPVPPERYAPPRSIADARPATCGLGDSGATMQLGARGTGTRLHTRLGPCLKGADAERRLGGTAKRSRGTWDPLLCVQGGAPSRVGAPIHAIQQWPRQPPHRAHAHRGQHGAPGPACSGLTRPSASRSSPSPQGCFQSTRTSMGATGCVRHWPPCHAARLRTSSRASCSG